jgi:hypothetical protein
VSGAATVELIRDEKLVLDILRHGELNLSKDVARVMPQKISERRIRRIGLEKDGHLIRAAFRDKAVKIDQRGTSIPEHHDTYYNEVAAYLVSKYLGLNNIPTIVLRSMPMCASGLKLCRTPREGTVQLWVENSVAQFDVSAEQIPYPGSPLLRNQQLKEILALDCLIGNVDRHAGNLLIDLNERFGDTENWVGKREPFRGKIWAIDHSRAFHTSPRLDPRSCRLKELGREAVSIDFIQGLRKWKLQEIAAILRASGLSHRQIERLTLKALDHRAQLLRKHFEIEQQESGLADKYFYSSGVWHHVW